MPPHFQLFFLVFQVFLCLFVFLLEVFGNFLLLHIKDLGLSKINILKSYHSM